MESVEARASDSDLESWLEDCIAYESLEGQLPSADEGVFASFPSQNLEIQCGRVTAIADDFFDQGTPGAPRYVDGESVQADSFPFDGTVNASSSSSDPSPMSTHYHDLDDDVTLDDFIRDLLQDLPAPRPGEDELVAAVNLPFDGTFNAYSSGSSVNSYLDQLRGVIDSNFDNCFGKGSMQPPHPESDVTHVQVHTQHPPDDAFDPEFRIVDALQVGSAGRRWPVVEPGERIGVGDRDDNGTWEARVWLKDVNLARKKNRNGMQCFVGSFATEDDAKRAHDKVAIKLNVRVSKTGTLYSLNYPEELYADEMAAHANWSRRDYLWKMRRESEKFSKGKCELKGVQPKKGGKPGYTASISVTQGKKSTMTIGQFETEGEAGRAYDRALLFIRGMYDLGCIPNFRPESYMAAEVEEAGQKLAAANLHVNFKSLKRKRCGVFV